MQTRILFWHLVYIKSASKQRDGYRHPATRELKMSKTASIALSPSTTLFGRLFSTIDRWLLAYAEMTIRNGDVPRVGV